MPKDNLFGTFFLIFSLYFPSEGKDEESSWSHEVVKSGNSNINAIILWTAKSAKFLGFLCLR